jgi:hypothetical protein
MHRSQRDVYDGHMEVTAPEVVAPTVSSTFTRKAVPLLTGGALAGAALVVALNDPSAEGTWYPPCAFHAATGLWCPGCGLTRGFHHLFNGDIGAALGYNVFVPLVLVAVAGSWWGWVRLSWGRAERVWPTWTRRWVSVVLPAALVVYGVLRNIPAAPFDALAP